jgi:hypothetical protein
LPEKARREIVEEGLVGRRVVIIHPSTGPGGPPMSVCGHSATIRGVFVDAVGTPCYTLELEDGELVDTYAANFRLDAAE